MSIHDNLARIRMVDVEALTKASTALVGAAATIKASKGAYVPAVIELLSEANETILAVRDRGLGRIQRYLAKMNDRLDREAGQKAPLGESAAGEHGTVQRGDKD
jgi:hypothetical protein